MIFRLLVKQKVCQRVKMVLMAVCCLLSQNFAVADTSTSGVYGLPVAAPEEVGLSSKELAKIGPAMQRFIDDKQAPNMLTVIARKGKVAHVQAQGYADVDAKTPLAPDAIFRIYSMTKPVAVVAAMMLYEEGKFQLDDPVSNYLPEFSNMKVFENGRLVDADRPVTIQHLLTHTSGLVYSGVVRNDHFKRLYGLPNEDERRLEGVTLEQHVKELAALPLFVQPGVEWHYGESMAVLSRLVEVLSGQSFRDFLRENIFAPLGMDDTGFEVPSGKASRLVSLYETDDQQSYVATSGYGEPYTHRAILASGGGGLVSTGSDYLRFCQMLLNGGELEGVRILQADTVSLIIGNHLPEDMGAGRPLATLGRTSFFDRPGFGFGFGGYVVVDSAVAKVPTRNGTYSWGGWANTLFWIDPQQEMIGLVFTQVIDGDKYGNGAVMMDLTYKAIKTHEAERQGGSVR